MCLDRCYHFIKFFTKSLDFRTKNFKRILTVTVFINWRIIALLEEFDQAKLYNRVRERGACDARQRRWTGSDWWR